MIRQVIPSNEPFTADRTEHVLPLRVSPVRQHVLSQSPFALKPFLTRVAFKRPPVCRVHELLPRVHGFVALQMQNATEHLGACRTLKRVLFARFRCLDTARVLVDVPVQVLLQVPLQVEESREVRVAVGTLEARVALQMVLLVLPHAAALGEPLAADAALERALLGRVRLLIHLLRVPLLVAV